MEVLSLPNPSVSFVSHHGTGIHSSLCPPPPHLQHLVNSIYRAAFPLFPSSWTLTRFHDWASPDVAAYLSPSSILRKCLSKSFSLISTTFLKGLLWCCVEKSTKAQEEAVFRIGVSTSNAHRSRAGSDVNWSQQDNGSPTSTGSGGGSTQP